MAGLVTSHAVDTPLEVNVQYRKDDGNPLSTYYLAAAHWQFGMLDH